MWIRVTKSGTTITRGGEPTMSLRPLWFCWNCRACNDSQSSRCCRCYTSRAAATAPDRVAHSLLNWSLLLLAFVAGFWVMYEATLSVLLQVQ